MVMIVTTSATMSPSTLQNGRKRIARLALRYGANINHQVLTLNHHNSTVRLHAPPLPSCAQSPTACSPRVGHVNCTVQNKQGQTCLHFAFVCVAPLSIAGNILLTALAFGACVCDAEAFAVMDTGSWGII